MIKKITQIAQLRKATKQVVDAIMAIGASLIERTNDGRAHAGHARTSDSGRALAASTVLETDYALCRPRHHPTLVHQQEIPRHLLSRIQRDLPQDNPQRLRRLRPHNGTSSHRYPCHRRVRPVAPPTHILTSANPTHLQQRFQHTAAISYSPALYIVLRPHRSTVDHTILVRRTPTPLPSYAQWAFRPPPGLLFQLQPNPQGLSELPPVFMFLPDMLLFFCQYFGEGGSVVRLGLFIAGFTLTINSPNLTSIFSGVHKIL